MLNMGSSQILRVIVCVLLISATVKAVRNRRHTGLPCPSECHCVTNYTTAITTLHCSSLNFVSKLSPKENTLITSLDLSNSTMTTLDKRLKKMINLEYLNLSHNKLSDLKHLPHLPKLTHLNLRSNAIKSFSAKNLPPTLTSLDISHNYIRLLPLDIKYLPLKRLDINGNPFSCNTESLEIRDHLVEHKVQIGGNVLCQDPPKFRGKSWRYVVDFDEYFKFQDQEEMQADEDGSGVGSGGFAEEGPDSPIETTTSDFTFEGSGVDEPIFIRKNVNEVKKRQRILDGPNKPLMVSPKTTEAESMSTTPVVNTAGVVTPDRTSNLGTNIFLGIFLLCLVALLIYAIKKNKERKREARRKRRNEKEKQRGMIELKQQQRKPSDKQNGNSEAVPLMNSQNGSSKPADSNTAAGGDVQDGIVPSTQVPLTSEKEPVSDGQNGDRLLCPTAPAYPANSDVKSVKVKAGEIPDSVPHTPILVNRSLSSDGKSIVVTPNLSQRSPSSGY